MKNKFNTPSKKNKIIDPNKKRYICGCSKEYKSYPALYTHIRTKHDGQKPEGTITHSSQKRKRRGRKRKQDYFDKKKEELQEGAMFGQIGQYKEEEKRQPISIFSDFKIEDFSFFEQPEYKGKCNYKACISLFTSDNNPIPKHFLNLQKLDKENVELEGPLSCDMLFAIFLYKVSNFVNKDFYLILVIFVKYFRQCLNDHGVDEVIKYEAKNKKFILKSLKTDITFTEQENTDYIPLVTNIFVRCYMHKYCETFPTELLIVLTKVFCNWLWANNLTKKKLEFIS